MLVFFLNFFRFYSIVQTWFDSSHAKVILSFFFPVLIIKGVSQQVASFVLSRCSTRQPLEFLLLCYSTLWNKVTLIACQRQPVLYVNRHACRYHCLLSRYCCDFHLHQTSSGDSKGGPGWPMAIGVRGGGSGGRPPPQAWKISGLTLFSGQALVAQKSWMIKNI